MSVASQRSSAKRRMRGSYVDNDGVCHSVNALVLHIEDDSHIPYVDAWETDCIDHWWNETPPKMSIKKVTCIVCLSYPVPEPLEALG